jgi:hypothetical protein
VLESLQIERERRPHHHKPNTTRLGSNGHRMREISCSVQNDKQAKKNVLTVQSVQDDDVEDHTTHGRCVGSCVDEST